jgi:hypothetical protein
MSQSDPSPTGSPSSSAPQFQPFGKHKTLADFVSLKGVMNGYRGPQSNSRRSIGLYLTSDSAKGHDYLFYLDDHVARNLIREIEHILDAQAELDRRGEETDDYPTIQ